MHKQIIEAKHLIDALQCDQENRIARAKAEIKQLPEGSLCIGKLKDKYYFKIKKDGKRYGITKDRVLIYKLARRRYLQLVCRSDFNKIESLLVKYSRAGLDIRRIIYTKEQYQWVTSKYPNSEFHTEELKYQTLAGVWVRSKSEQAIGNLMEKMGIAYRYEIRLQVDVGWMEDVLGTYSGGRHKDYYPDFVIMLADGSKVIWEHLGLVHLSNYRNHNAEKIFALRQSGLIPDDRLILTFEQDMVKADTLRKIISHRLLPLGVI